LPSAQRGPRPGGVGSRSPWGLARRARCARGGCGCRRRGRRSDSFYTVGGAARCRRSRLASRTDHRGEQYPERRSARSGWWRCRCTSAPQQNDAERRDHTRARRPSLFWRSQACHGRHSRIFRLSPGLVVITWQWWIRAPSCRRRVRADGGQPLLTCEMKRAQAPR